MIAGAGYNGSGYCFYMKKGGDSVAESMATVPETVSIVTTTIKS